jgi:hypothetical protein
VKNAYQKILFLIAIMASVGLASDQKKVLSKIDTSSGFYIYLSPLFMAHDIAAIAHSISAIPFEQQISLLDMIVDNKSELSSTEIMLIFILVLQKTPERHKQEALQNSFAKHTHLIAEIPPLYIASIRAPKTVPIILSWLESRPDLKKQRIENAINYAIKKDNPKAVTVLFHYKAATITPEQATGYLWASLEKNRNAGFVTFLAGCGADINNKKGGKTPLVEAVQHNNIDNVKALVKAGAHVNAFADPAVGTPLQIAIRDDYTPIELFLRKNGARE